MRFLISFGDDFAITSPIKRVASNIRIRPY